MASGPGGAGDRSTRDDELAAARSTVEELQQALQSNRRIGIAMGLLMERYDVSAEGAFATLTRLSQADNRKLVDIATELVDTRRLPGGHGSGSSR